MQENNRNDFISSFLDWIYMKLFYGYPILFFFIFLDLFKIQKLMTISYIFQWMTQWKIPLMQFVGDPTDLRVKTKGVGLASKVGEAHFGAHEGSFSKVDKGMPQGN